MAAKLFALSFFLAAVLLVGASRNTVQVVNEIILKKPDAKASQDVLTVIQDAPVTRGLGDTYCCLKDGFGTCLQECDSDIKYYCCLKNGFGDCKQFCDETKDHFCCLENGFGGCVELCEEGHEYYCCKKNAFGGCLGMCPKSSTVTLEQVTSKL